MKKKIIPLLFFFFGWEVSNALPLDDASPAAVATENDDSNYLLPLENYVSFIADPIRMDFLYNLDTNPSSKFHSMKKMDWHNLLRRNAAFVYAVRINQSRFALCPGIGWSTLCYSFAGQKNGDEIIYPTLKRNGKERTDCQDLDNESGRKYAYSGISISFIDLLLRFRFNTVLDDPKAGFHTWLGVKFGFRTSASNIVKYKEYDDTGASCVEEGSFNLKPYTWALQAAVGYSRFGLTATAYCAPLFEQRQGPADSDSLRPFSFSIYVDLL